MSPRAFPWRPGLISFGATLVAATIWAPPSAVNQGLASAGLLALLCGAVRCGRQNGAHGASTVSGYLGWRVASPSSETPARDQAADGASIAGRLFARTENASDLIVLGHDDGRRSYISPASVRLVGFTPGELEIEMQARRWVHPDDLGVLANAEIAEDDTGTAVACRVRRKDGSWIWVEAIFRRMSSCAAGEPTIIATFRDVTERQAQAQALRDARDAADVARQAAEQTSQAKSDFLATMSHEIRTPLNAILGFAELLQSDGALNPASRLCIERIRSAGLSLRVVVDDILDFSKLEAGGVEIRQKAFSPRALVENAAAITRVLADSKGLALHVVVADATPAYLVGDYDRLRQVLLNLLNNAIKFTRQGAVSVHLDVEPKGDDAVGLTFRVKDTGIGIPADQLPRLFQRFSQIDGSISREFGGTGLGLAICRSLVEAMSGRIGVESVVGHGSTFWFGLSLPTHCATAPVPGGRDSPRGQGNGLELFDDLVAAVGSSAQDRTTARPGADDLDHPVRALGILLVEDVRLNQELVVALLEARGHQVDVVGNGAEAVMAVADKDYDLVLMDLQMPHVDGLTATRLIRNSAAHRRFIPIVALTAAVLREQTDAALAAGMNGVLTKPLVKCELDAVLRKAARDELREPLDPAALDRDLVAELARVVGDVKIRSMRRLLKTSLVNRFATAFTPMTASSLKAEAHASIAGASMLGFVRFGILCRAFIAAEGPETENVYDGLCRELDQVVRTLQALEAEAELAGGEEVARIAF